jgi:hypothetical protein
VTDTSCHLAIAAMNFGRKRKPIDGAKSPQSQIDLPLGEET